MRTFAGLILWRAAYRRLVRSSFATVPLYREQWALHGRTDPVLVPGREGTGGGVVPAELAVRRLADLVPLAGGGTELDPLRGLGSVLRRSVRLRRGGLVAVLDATRPRPPADLPRGLRGCVLDPGTLPAGTSPAMFSELVNTLRRGQGVIAVGRANDLATLAAAVPADLSPRLTGVPRRELDGLDSGPFGILADATLGVLGGLRGCGRWHVDWTQVYARSTPAGLAFSLLRQRSPRLVDILPAGGVPGEVAPCPRHGTPVLLT